MVATSMLSKLTSLGSAAKGGAKGRAQRDDRETLREVMHSNALGVAALAERVRSTHYKAADLACVSHKSTLLSK